MDTTPSDTGGGTLSGVRSGDTGGGNPSGVRWGEDLVGRELSENTGGGIRAGVADTAGGVSAGWNTAGEGTATEVNTAGEPSSRGMNTGGGSGALLWSLLGSCSSVCVSR